MTEPTIHTAATSSRTYNVDAKGAEILDRMNCAPRFNKWMADVIRPYVGDRVLEIGAGIGNLSVHVMPRSVYWATDIQQHYLDYLYNLRLTRPYMRVGFTDAEKAETFPSGQRFDSVICLNVVEHIPDDLAALRNIRAILEPGGRAIILVPFGPGLFGTLDEVLGHCRRYTDEHLARVARQAGFHVQQILKFNRPGVFAWWLNGRILKKRTFDLGQIRILNILTPIFRRIDNWLPLPPLSIIAILKKEAIEPAR